MKVSLKKAFSLLDGRLSTEIRDIYEMLNYIFEKNFITHQLPLAITKLQEENPEWFSQAKKIIDEIKKENKTNNFNELMNIIDKKYPNIQIELGKLKSDINFFPGIY